MTGATARRGRLPLHPRPLPHEALSSWVGRLASAYGMVPDAFLRTALGIDPAPDDRELDGGAGSPGLSSVLAERTGVPERRILAMTLAGYAPRLTGAPVSSAGLFSADAGRACWFMPTTGDVETDPEPDEPWVPWQADDLLAGMPRCCPGCLWADAVPYVRLYWRWAWMASCPQHAEALVPVVRSPWLIRDHVPREPQRAAPDLLVLDHVTLGVATGGPARLPGCGGSVPGATWLRALRALLNELTCPASRFEPEVRAEVDGAWWRAGRTPRERQLCQSDLFERQPPDRRSVLLQVAGAVVRHRAARLAPGSQETMLRATVRQLSADQRREARMA